MPNSEQTGLARLHLVADRAGEPEVNRPDVDPFDRLDELAREELHSLVDSYRLHEQRVYRICLGYLRNPDDARDATQETFVRAARYVRNLSGDVLAAYLSVVARRVCSRQADRRRRQGIAVQELRAAPPSEADPEALAADADVVHSVWTQLSRREQALVLYRFAGYSYDEIAGRLGISAGGVRLAVSRLRHRARQLLDTMRAWLLLPLQTVWSRWKVARRLSGSATGMVPTGVGGGGASLLLAKAVALIAAAAMVGWVGVRATHVLTAPDSQDVASLDGASPLSGVAFSGGAASPAGSGDGTVWLTGFRMDACAAGQCPVLYRSQDRGRTWQQVAAHGFAGGSLMLPPQYPQDPDVFAATPQGLQESRDGGASFQTVAALGGPMAMSPASTPDDEQVLIGSQPMWIYDVHARALLPGPSLPAGVTRIDAVAYAGDAQHLLVTGAAVATDNPAVTAPVAISCAGRSCHVALTVRDAAALGRAVELSSMPTRAVVLYAGASVYVSGDGGATFSRMHAFPGGAVLAGGVDASPGRATRVVLAVQDAGSAATLVGSDDSGKSFRALARSGTAVTWLVGAPGGQLLAGLTGPDQQGAWVLTCAPSRDRGEWSYAC